MIICTDVAIWFIHFLMLNLLMTASNLVNLFYLILNLLMIKSYHGCPSLYGIIWTSICSWSWFSELHPIDCIPPPGDLPRVNNYSCLVACFGIQFPSDHFNDPVLSSCVRALAMVGTCDEHGWNNPFFVQRFIRLVWRLSTIYNYHTWINVH